MGPVMENRIIMIVNIDFTDSLSLQNMLNDQFGTEIFYVGTDKSQTPKQLYLEYLDNTPQNLVDQALAIASQQALLTFNDTKIRCYQYLITVSQKQIEKLDKPIYTTVEIQEASSWLQNQTLPVPACVSYTALSFDLTNQQAAQKIVDSQATYDSLSQQIKTLELTGQQQIMNATDTYSAKTIASDYMEQIKNIS